MAITGNFEFKGCGYRTLEPSLCFIFDSGADQIYRPLNKTDLGQSAGGGGSSAALQAVSGFTTTVSTNTVSNRQMSGDYGLCLPANPNRKSLFLQSFNTGIDNLIWVSYNTTAYSGNNFNYTLAPQSTLNAGDGQSASDDSWRGAVSVTGIYSQNIAYICWESTV